MLALSIPSRTAIHLLWGKSYKVFCAFYRNDRSFGCIVVKSIHRCLYTKYTQPHNTEVFLPKCLLTVPRLYTIILRCLKQAWNVRKQAVSGRSHLGDAGRFPMKEFFYIVHGQRGEGFKAPAVRAVHFIESVVSRMLWLLVKVSPEEIQRKRFFFWSDLKGRRCA